MNQADKNRQKQQRDAFKKGNDSNKRKLSQVSSAVEEMRKMNASIQSLVASASGDTSQAPTPANPPTAMGGRNEQAALRKGRPQN